MKERKIIESQEIEMEGHKVIIELREISTHGKSKRVYVKPFAYLKNTQAQNATYWRNRCSTIEKELEESRKREKILKNELLGRKTK